MNEAAKEARREYKRKWAKEHPEKLREYQKTYWERKAAEAEPAEQPAAIPTK